MSAVVFAEDQSPDLQPLRPLGVTYTEAEFFPRHDDSPMGIVSEPILEPAPDPIVFSPQPDASGPIDSYVIIGNETIPGPYTGTSSGSAPIFSDLMASPTSLDPGVQQVPEPRGTKFVAHSAPES